MKNHNHCNHNHTHSDDASCCCGSAHTHNINNIKIMYFRIIISFILIIFGLIIKNHYISFLSYTIISYDILYSAVKNIFTKHILSEHFLMGLASVCALLLGEYFEASAIMLLYQTGELLTSKTNQKSKQSIKELIDLNPQYANLFVDDRVEKVSPQSLKENDVVIVSTGERIPADGIIIEGSTILDASSITGEEEERKSSINDEVLGGYINKGQLIKIKITKSYHDSSISKINKMLDEIESTKSPSERFMTKFSKYYTPIVVLLAILVFAIPSLFLNLDYKIWGYKALVLLVVSCPCALVISIPLSLLATKGCCSKNGILIKGTLPIEKMSDIKTVAFDKTGTITEGSFKIISLRCNGIKTEMLEKLAYAEFYSTHPLAETIISEYKKTFGLDIEPKRISDYTEIAGKGISVRVDDDIVLVGNEKLMNENNIDFQEAQTQYTVSYIAVNGKFLGYAEFSDGIKPNTQKAIVMLQKMNIITSLLSGDKKKSVLGIGNILNISNCYYELLPDEKVNIIDEFKKEGNVCFVGDGINDVPVIAKADVGVSMGLNGSDAAIEASDVVILSDDISKIVKLIDISKKGMKIVKQNIILTVGIKSLIMILGIFGVTNLWLAVFGDVGVSLMVILNSLRALNEKKEH